MKNTNFILSMIFTMVVLVGTLCAPITIFAQSDKINDGGMWISAEGINSNNDSALPSSVQLSFKDRIIEIWIEGNFYKTELKSMQPGQTINLDLYNDSKELSISAIMQLNRDGTINIEWDAHNLLQSPGSFSIAMKQLFPKS